jgi:2-polyprenyl-6-methoxyphenol hydroxylase-like FAD-dependent oxidoreductase
VQDRLPRADVAVLHCRTGDGADRRIAGRQARGSAGVRADAANLAWKLAAAVHGWAPDGLLDSYQTARHPVGESVLTHTHAESALLGPGPGITAVRTFFGEMLQQPACNCREQIAYRQMMGLTPG